MSRADLRSGGPATRAGDAHFTGNASNIEGIGIFQVAEEVASGMHCAAFGNDPVLANDLDAGGEYAFRIRGEEHMRDARLHR